MTHDLRVESRPRNAKVASWSCNAAAAIEAVKPLMVGVWCNPANYFRRCLVIMIRGRPAATGAFAIFGKTLSTREDMLICDQGELPERNETIRCGIGPLPLKQGNKTTWRSLGNPIAKMWA